MADEFDYVSVPRDSVNDDHVILVAWRVEDGAQIRRDDLLCEVETSKATVEITAQRDGWVFHLRTEGDEVPVGSPIAALGDSAARPSGLQRSDDAAEVLKVTRKAQQLIEQHQLDLSMFDGFRLVRERDVQDVLQRPAAATPSLVSHQQVTPASAIKRRAAKVLTESYTTIPHSYVSRWIDAALCQQHVDQLSRQHDLSATVSDLLAHAVARVVAEHPKANSAWQDSAIVQHTRINVGFALNLADGDLIVPVIHDAERRSFEDLVAAIRDHQRSAVRKKLTPQDLSAGTVTISSLLGTGVQQVLPLIVPGQSAIIAIADALPGATGSLYCLTMAFDHRVMNGSEAAEVLAALATFMQKG